MIYIIGCGGVGSWLAPAICMLVKPENVTLIDGDTLEEKNMNRQLFNSSDIGHNKSIALARRYKCNSIDSYYSSSSVAFDRDDWVFCVVDNHPGRKAVLDSCDMHGCRAVFAANETHSSEAFIYHPTWKTTQLDPRVYYPEIVSDTGGDPRAIAIGCTGEAQEANPQLATANFMAAALASHLFVLWAKEINKMGKEALPYLPYKLVNNLTRNETHLIGDKLQ